jgi:hypothetical protein
MVGGILLTQRNPTPWSYPSPFRLFPTGTIHQESNEKVLKNRMFLKIWSDDVDDST